MRIATLIMAHEAPEQLRSLAERMLREDAGDRVIVHLDAKSALWADGWGDVLRELTKIEVVPRPVAVRWGHVSQVAAIRVLLRAALAGPCDLLHLVSGLDWPVASRDEIAARAADAECFIEAVPHLQSERMDAFRLDARWLRPNPDNFGAWHAAQALRRLSSLVPRRRSHPWGPWHKGSTWWSLPRDVAEVVFCELDAALRNHRLVGTVCADEHVIPTIVASRFASRIASNRRFIRWQPGAASPAVLGADDCAKARASGAWFARKLSLADDPFFLAY
ncbi:beta-1,6-N-acetylglucosaminyltransferase [Novosphingobium sp. Gsoil 351]|uniref:beta-1,6-N-acetylglucosaminyltransferase n=1 Tax=Novosphingobium sp. Gsoil 351 TaxID=2675225 RepID=UPI0012B4F69D|nr:beta-1,6-N-acetylglucosaminyltransferase [Novosphingobium sp. Gsoil 351]QGN53860.1 glycosyl transferase [Novosphingobium sp. Gsoil 351]